MGGPRRHTSWDGLQLGMGADELSSAANLAQAFTPVDRRRPLHGAASSSSSKPVHSKAGGVAGGGTPISTPTAAARAGTPQSAEHGPESANAQKQPAAALPKRAEGEESAEEEEEEDGEDGAGFKDDRVLRGMRKLNATLAYMKKNASTKGLFHAVDEQDPLDCRTVNTSAAYPSHASASASASTVSPTLAATYPMLTANSAAVRLAGRCADAPHHRQVERDLPVVRAARVDHA